MGPHSAARPARADAPRHAPTNGPRARTVGVVIGELPPGPQNAITDVPDVLVGHRTLIAGHGRLQVGRGPIRTGVTVVLPAHDIWYRPVFAAAHRLNGNGELTGIHWMQESGLLTTPIGLTNTHSLGVVRDALATVHARLRRSGTMFWSLPVVGETYDGVLNDIDGQHVQPSHVEQALEKATSGPVMEGAIGGGTGMICHGFKGGIGTASRNVAAGEQTWTVGVLVQANHGRRERLTVAGVPVGRAVPTREIPEPDPPERHVAGAGSIIVIVATNAPLLPHQCARLAQRAGLGVARTGGSGEHYSGDLFLAFSTGNRLPPDVYGEPGPDLVGLQMLRDEHLTPLFDAVVEATEESIVNVLVAARTMVGRDDVTAYALGGDRLRTAMTL